MHNKVDIRELKSDEWQIFKDIRLRALKESPSSFGRSYEDEIIFTDHDWQKRMLGANLIIADTGESLVGIVSLRRSDADSSIMTIGSMWVDPNYRKTGIGNMLIERLLKIAKLNGAKRVEGGCMAHNVEALNFYENLGFKQTGKTLPIEKDASLTENEIAFSFG